MSQSFKRFKLFLIRADAVPYRGLLGLRAARLPAPLRAGPGANIRQSRPDPGLGFKVKALQRFQVVPSALGRGMARERDGQGCTPPLPVSLPLCHGRGGFLPYRGPPGLRAARLPDPL